MVSKPPWFSQKTRNKCSKFRLTHNPILTKYHSPRQCRSSWTNLHKTNLDLHITYRELLSLNDIYIIKCYYTWLWWKGNHTYGQRPSIWYHLIITCYYMLNHGRNAMWINPFSLYYHIFFTLIIVQMLSLIIILFSDVIISYTEFSFMLFCLSSLHTTHILSCQLKQSLRNLIMPSLTIDYIKNWVWDT